MNTLPASTKDSPSQSQTTRAIEYVLAYRARKAQTDNQPVTVVIPAPVLEMVQS